jgi:hypothetical protein
MSHPSRFSLSGRMSVGVKKRSDTDKVNGTQTGGLAPWYPCRSGLYFD